MIRQLTYLDVVALHEEVLKRLGLPPAALRDPNGLESAVMRPRMAETYEDADRVRQAVLLAVGISQSQAFVDGNKRAAFASLQVFLRINSYRYAGQPIELAQQLINIAERTSTLAEATDRFETWLRQRTAILDAD